MPMELHGQVKDLLPQARICTLHASDPDLSPDLILHCCRQHPQDDILEGRVVELLSNACSVQFIIPLEPVDGARDVLELLDPGDGDNLGLEV